MKIMTCFLILLILLDFLSLQQSVNPNSPQSRQTKEERLKQIQRKRKELEERYAQELKEAQNDQKQSYEVDGEITHTEKVKQQERDAFHNQARDSNEEFSAKKQFLFETSKQMDEFVLNIPHRQKVGIYVKIYVIKDNSYKQIQDVDEEPPVRIYVYENNNRLISQKQFYFEGIILFEGKQDSTYTIRFYTTGYQKLISVIHNMLIQSRHVENLLGSSEVQNHAVKAKTVQNQIQVIFKRMEQTNAIVRRSTRRFNERIKYYFYYQLAELFVVLLVCFAQVTLIKNTLKGQSII